MNKIYGTYRMKYTNTGVRYTPSYFLDKQYEDYKKAGLTSIKDNIIPENRYTTELVPGIKKMTRFIIGEYNDLYVDPIKYKANIVSVGAEFNIEIFATPADAIVWIKANTDLVEETPGKFLIQEAGKDIMGNTIDAQYLVIV